MAKKYTKALCLWLCSKAESWNMFCSVIGSLINMTFDPVANKPNTTLCKINAWKALLQQVIDLCVALVLDGSGLTIHTILSIDSLWFKPIDSLLTSIHYSFFKWEIKNFGLNIIEVNEIGQTDRNRDMVEGGKREELIGNVADHYLYHACVMTLITPLNRPLPPLTHKQLKNTRLNDKLRT